MRPLTHAFGFLFTAAAGLCLAASLLVTASLFIADRAPTSLEFLGISLFVSGVFLAIGLLLVGVVVQVVGIARIAAATEPAAGEGLRRRVARLLLLLVVAGLAMCGLMAIVVYGILARIDEGFAVFG